MERFEIVIVGGGVIGCAIARELARSGARVCLLERGRIGGESSGAAAGMLGVQSENEDELLLQLGAESRRMYPSTLAALETETAVSVEFWRQGTLYCCFTEDDEVRLEDRRRRQQATGLDSRWLTNRQTRAREPALSTSCHDPNNLCMVGFCYGSVCGGLSCNTNAPCNFCGSKCTLQGSVCKCG